MDKITTDHKVITITGFSGSGKSTAAKNLAKSLDYQYYSVGVVIRDMAKKLGISVLEMSKKIENDLDFEKSVDQAVVDFVKNQEGGVVLEGRLAAWFMRKEGIPAYNVWLEAPLDIRSKRLNEREQLGEAQALEYTRGKDDSEVLRYKKHYNIDIMDKSVYDLIVNVETRSIEQVLSFILENL